MGIGGILLLVGVLIWLLTLYHTLGIILAVVGLVLLLSRGPWSPYSGARRGGGGGYWY